MTRIAIVAANAIMRSGTQSLLRGGGIAPNCVTAFESVAEFLVHPERQDFMVLLLDDEPYTSYIEDVIHQLLETQASLQIVLLSERLMVGYIRRIIKQGAGGFVFKDGDMEQMLPMALSAMQRGTVYLSPEVSEMLLTNDTVSLSGLTKRDMAVLHLMAAELNVQQIAFHLHTSDRTVYRSREKLRETLGVQTNEMIVDAARQQGVLDDA
jgi:DNA-binding NarL/FixJ family response regulator